MFSLIASSIVFMAAQAASETIDTCSEPLSVAQETSTRTFTQERSLVGIEQSLVSSGRVEVSEDVIRWIVSDPIEISTVISSGGMTQSIEGGPAQPIGAAGASNPLLSESGLIKLLKGDLTNVEASYDVNELANEGGWGVSLVPKADEMAQHVSGIEVYGCTKIDIIKVNQSNGDTIKVSFSKG